MIPGQLYEFATGLHDMLVEGKPFFSDCIKIPEKYILLVNYGKFENGMKATFYASKGIVYDSGANVTWRFRVVE